MRIACVIVPHLSVQVTRSQDSGFADRPLVIGRLSYEKRPVYYASPEAATCGVKPGIPLLEAEQKDEKNKKPLRQEGFSYPALEGYHC